MFVQPQEKFSNKISEITTNFNAMPASENATTPTMPFSFVPSTNLEGDVASVNSFRTTDTNYTGDQESVASDFALREHDLQGIIKILCELDGGLNIALERVKQDELSTFLRKRAAIEEEYGKMMMKLAKNLQESHHTNDTKQGSYGDSWLSILKIHEYIGENRIKLASAIQEISEDVSFLYKDIDKARKNLKDSGQKYEKAIQDSETSLEKAKGKYDSYSEDWERSILQKHGDSPITSKPKTLPKSIFSKQPKTPSQLIKMEEDARNKAEAANATYKQQLLAANTARHDYYDVQLPSIITTLKETADECDVGLQYHLARYSYLFENTIVCDGLVIQPINEEDGPALRKTVEKISNEEDFYNFVKSHDVMTRKTKKFDIPYDQYNLSTQAVNIINPKNIFGVDLAEQMQRDGHDVPLILVKCCEAIEQYGGLQSKGLYRISGVTSHVQRLRMLFDRNADAFDFNAEENLDVNNITSVLKLWFRELPDPLFTMDMYQDFINAAKNPDDRRRVLELHDRVNHLPDANYSTLKYLMGHLNQVVKNQEYNKMNVQNLGIVFGPTLLGSPVIGGANSTSGVSGSVLLQNDGAGLNDMSWQCKLTLELQRNWAHRNTQSQEDNPTKRHHQDLGHDNVSTPETSRYLSSINTDNERVQRVL
ncbi:15309_t:CDS:10, partial [Funneliformis geosporum]